MKVFGSTFMLNNYMSKRKISERKKRIKKEKR